MLTVFTSLACSPRRTSRVGEDCRPRTTWRPLTLAGSPALPPLRLTGGFCHADQTVPRQDVNSSFPPCVCHPSGKRCLHTRRSGPSRVRRRLFLTCLALAIRLPRSILMEFKFFSHVCYCSVKTELIGKNNYAKNSLSQLLDSPQ